MSHARRCSPHRQAVREDGSGSVSSQVVAKVVGGSTGQRGGATAGGDGASSLTSGATPTTASFRGVSCLKSGAIPRRFIAY